MRSRVEQFAGIRRDHRVDGLSIRALADKYGVHRRTVRQAFCLRLSRTAFRCGRARCRCGCGRGRPVHPAMLG